MIDGEPVLQAPTVSVIIPTHNRAHLLGRAIQSVLAQTFQDLEMLVVDDASTDNTEEVVGSFCDPRVIYLRHDLNKGGSAARNTGIRAARGEYLAFLDSDDEWLPQKLGKQLEVFTTSQDESLGLVVCGLIDARGPQRRVVLPRPLIWTRELFLENKCHHHGTPMLLVRVSAFPELPLFDERFPAYQDWDYVVRVMKWCTVGFVREGLVVAHRDDGNHVGTDTNRIKGQRLIIDKYGRELKTLPKAQSFHHYRHAQYLQMNGYAPLACNHMWRAIRANPIDLRLYPWLVSMVLITLGFGPILKRVSRQLRRAHLLQRTS